jgi:phosphotransferase system enzyme I (PtsI)
LETLKEEIFQGIPASPGIVIGVARALARDFENVQPDPITDPELEIKAFRDVISTVKKSLEKTADLVLQRMGPEYARIFEAQVLIAGDEVWNKNIEERIAREKVCAEYIYYDEATKVIRNLDLARDAYLKERAQDIQAVTARLVGRLRGEKQMALKVGFDGPTVVVARYLSPGDILALSVRKNLGFVTAAGGPTSHAALMAKSLSVPAVIGLGPAADKINTSAEIIIDGHKGLVILNPSKQTLKYYRNEIKSESNLRKQLDELKTRPALTLDGAKIDVLANIELPSEVNGVLASGASGIGLYRTEYLFLTRSSFPTFDEQYTAYSSILRQMKRMPVVIRTFDLGGDKVPDVGGQHFETNPFLGWRAIRFCLDRPAVFKIQLKALLKSSTAGNLSIMIPMISNIDEIIMTKKLLEECKVELRTENIKIAEKIPLGIMIEVPSAVLIAEHLAREVDFFSIGTNDLIQYTLAVDRDHQLISKLYQSFHPAVLQLIKLSVYAAHRHKMKVSVCGEMAGDPLAAVLLIGLGVDELSATFQTAGILKKIVTSISRSGAKKIAEKVLEMKSHTEIEQYMKKEVARVFPDIMPVIHFARRNSDA